MKKAYSMKEIADSIGVNKMKVYRSITSNHYKEQYKNGQTLYFSETVKKLVEKDLTKETVTENRNKENSKSNGELIDALEERINSQQKQIEDLTRLLDQSQKLQLIAEKKVMTLEKPLQNGSEENNSSKENTSNEEKKESNNKNRGFLHRIFRKNQ